MGCFCGAAVVATDPATLGAGESIFQGIILLLNFLQKFRFIGHYQRMSMASQIRASKIESHWSVVSFLRNVVIFLLSQESTHSGWLDK